MKTVFTALRLLVVFAALTGVVYPLAITALGRAFFPATAQGSLVRASGRIVGSALLAQDFQSERYFWPRPSAGQFATIASAASHAAPTSAALQAAIQDRAQRIRAAHQLPAEVPVPADLVTTSGSGLDPHLSPAAIRLQADRVARARGLADGPGALEALINRYTEPAGLFGKDRINVLKLNLALDEFAP